MPAWCAACTPAHTASMMSATRSNASGDCAMAAARVSPCKNSIAMNGNSHPTSKSKILTTLGCSSRAAACASMVNRLAALRLLLSAFDRILSATLRFKRASRAS